MNLKIKNVLIVGGSKGIGKEIALEYLSKKHNVSIISRTAPNFNEFQNDYSFKFFQCDVTLEDSYKKTANQIIKDFKNTIDIIVFCVGSGAGARVNFSDMSNWEKSWDLNFRSSVLTANLFHKKFNKNNQGSLIFISSIAGIEFLGAPDSYSLAKSSLISFSKSLSKVLGPNIRVNTVSPGNIFVKNGTWDMLQQKNPEEVNKMLEEKVPLKRFGTPKDVANLVVFLSSNKASFISGSNIVIDGGQTNGY
jgi:3-oxoacyl-[acyl-carrier protein] reductase